MRPAPSAVASDAPSMHRSRHVTVRRAVALATGPWGLHRTPRRELEAAGPTGGGIVRYANGFPLTETGAESSVPASSSGEQFSERVGGGRRMLASEPGAGARKNAPVVLVEIYP